ncbi:MAG: orotidine-5'-phosphate decarboxylase [Cyclobacteriaceae bacterium]|nr:orotidine-5'-phosphate decarboxylase [Cyclobacteriaceae bacterium]
MKKSELFSHIQSTRSYLCVGLDTDIQKIPAHLKKEKDPVFEFNKQIIDATLEYCIAYKPNIAFYEALGGAGWESLQKTVEYIPKNKFKIADAKRGDIGNTSSLYAKAFFENMSFDAITVAPYMGKDSVTPFLEYKNKWTIVLAHTSNQGSKDFQVVKNTSGNFLYEDVMLKSMEWGDDSNMMFVVGATRSDKMREIRKLAPDHFFLVPGVGAQGGSLEEVSKYGLTKSCGLIVNSSRGIIYASNNKNFAKDAAISAKLVQQEMDKYLDLFLANE